MRGRTSTSSCGPPLGPLVDPTDPVLRAVHGRAAKTTVEELDPAVAAGPLAPHPEPLPLAGPADRPRLPRDPAAPAAPHQRPLRRRASQSMRRWGSSHRFPFSSVLTCSGPSVYPQPPQTATRCCILGTDGPRDPTSGMGQHEHEPCRSTALLGLSVLECGLTVMEWMCIS